MMRYAKKLAAFFLIASLLLPLAGRSVYASLEPDEAAAAAADGSDEPDSAEETETYTADAAEEPGSPETPDGPASDGKAEAPERAWIEPGNTDAAIREGGWYLLAEDAVYYSDGGIWAETKQGTRYICEDDAAYLNLVGELLYYAVPGGDVRRVPLSGGAAETVFSLGSELRELYVLGPELRFLAEGSAYSYDMETAELTALDAPAGTTGLIPTPFGNVFLTGGPQDYTLWAGTEALCGGVRQVWRDGGWLVLVLDAAPLKASVGEAFSGRFALSEYDLHREAAPGSELSEEEQLLREAAYYGTGEYADFLESMAVPLDGEQYYVNSNSRIDRVASEEDGLTQDQKNMLLRAQRMLSVRWTALSDVAAYGADDPVYFNSISSWYSAVRDVNGTESFGCYAEGHTYAGIPYSQPVYGQAYVGWDVSVNAFLYEVSDPDSKMYSARSTFSHDGPYYGSDCSAFVSWVWATDRRGTITTLATTFSENLGRDISKLRVGDCIDDPTAHVVLVTDIGYDAEGKVVAVEITEQTPWLMRTYCFGELFPGRSYSYHGALTSFVYYYLGGGYSIYRRAVETPVPAPETVLRGDSNRDETVDALDAARILMYAGRECAESAIDLTAADADESGAVDRLDAALVLRCAVGIVRALP